MGKTHVIGTIAAAALAIQVCAVAVAEGPPPRIKIDGRSVEATEGDTPLFLYRFADVPYKPCVQELRTPGGVNILRDAPHDHLHHHALMFAVAVDGVNFWEEAGAPGSQVHREIGGGAADGNVGRARLVERLDWMPPKASGPSLEEQRTLEIGLVRDSKMTLLTWRSQFELPEGKASATLSGAHYFGLGMRFVESMDTGGRFITADGAEGEIVRGTERNIPARWCAYAAAAGGKPVTVAMFGHPKNRRAPTTWFTMTEPFAYLAATLNLHKEPLELRREDGPLTLRYGVALWDGHVEEARIEAAYRLWLGTGGAGE